MSDSENDSYTSDHNENIEKPIKLINPIKPKRVMSEKQLENLQKARVIAHAKLKDKKKETQLMKKKEQELKILKKLDKNITVDKKIKHLKDKIIYTPEDNKEQDEQIIYLKKPSQTRTKKQNKKIVYVTDSESEEEILYLKKPRTQSKPPTKPRALKKQQQFIEDLDEQEKIEKETQDKIVEKHYNDKIALIKREYLMKSVFQP